MAPFSVPPRHLILLSSFLRLHFLHPFLLLPLSHSGPQQANGNQQLQEERLGVLVEWGWGAARVKGGHSTGKVIAGAPLQGHHFPPFKGCMVTSVHPFSSYTTPHPSLTPLRPPLALLFLCSQGSRRPRVNKVIPGVGQREAFPLNSHPQQNVGPPFHTTESCWDVERKSAPAGKGWPWMSK